MKKMGNNIRLKKIWNFNGNVPLFFDKHISKSVPFYEECHNLLLEMSDHFVSENSKLRVLKEEQKIFYDIKEEKNKLQAINIKKK